MKLTARQQSLLNYLRHHLVEHQTMPTVREIMDYMGIKSPNGVVGHLDALERKEVIERTGFKACGIRLKNVKLTLEPVSS